MENYPLNVKNRLNKIFEITWLIIGISSIIALVYYYFKFGLEPVKPLFIIIPVSGIFYYSRRKRGREIDKEH